MRLIEDIVDHTCSSLGFIDELILLEVALSADKVIIAIVVLLGHHAVAESQFILRAHEGIAHVGKEAVLRCHLSVLNHILGAQAVTLLVFQSDLLILGVISRRCC